MNLYKEAIFGSEGGEVMIGEINQENLHLIIPSKVSWLAGMLVDHNGMTITVRADWHGRGQRWRCVGR